MRCYVVGYAPRGSVLYEDLEDFPVGTVLNWEEVKCGVNEGTFPPGLILQVPGGEPCVVVGRYGELEVMRLAEFVMGEEGRVERAVRKRRKDAGLGRKPYVMGGRDLP